MLIVAAAWGARWSPAIINIEVSRHAQMDVSLAGAFEIASVQIATGLGAVLAALFAAAGPGRDFVDGHAEIYRARGTPTARFLARTLTVTILTVTCGLVAAAALVTISLVIGAHDGFAVALRSGNWNFRQMLVGVLLAAAQSTWVVAVSQRLRTQAAQLTLPVALCVAAFLISRLSPYPITPDSWLGPLLGLQAERSMLDFWWSVGGAIAAPWGNAILLAVAAVLAAAFGVRADRPVNATRVGVAPSSGPLSTRA